jgi:hypothetical protein
MHQTSDNLVSLIYLLQETADELPDLQLNKGQVFDSKGNTITL